MNTLKKQNGMATILFVLLIGLTVMIITATVSKSLRSNKEASVSAHAQTNVQLMGWAGVSAFREYLIKQGNLNINNLAQLTGKSVVLRNDYNSKKISANNIAVFGCATEGASCTVTAEISANNLTSQAATTIQAVYEFSIKNGLVTAAGASTTVNLASNASFIGSLMEAEVPNTKVTLQVDGNVYIGSSLVKGFRTKNISELTINSTGDVRINCAYSNCSNTKINVNAKGLAELTNGGVYGHVNATKSVSLATNVEVESISSLDKVYISNSSTKLIHANKEVSLTAGAFGGYIYSNSDVTLSASRANSISVHGNISMTDLSSVSNNIESAKHVYLFSSNVGGDIKAYDYVDLNGLAISRSKVNGSVIAKGKNLTSIPLLGSYAVTLTNTVVDQNVYAKGRVELFLISSIGGKTLSSTAYLTTAQKTELDGKLNFTIPVVVNTTRITNQINDLLNFKTRVDVKAYKDEANYIFTKENSISRIYLNKLKNESNGTTYMYKDGKQYAIKGNTETFINDQGFYLGKYTLGAKEYVGAICLSIDSERLDIKSGKCTSPIIGYLPRVSVETKFEGGIFQDRFGLPDDYLYRFDILNAAFNTAKTHTWYLRSNADISNINNAAFAPGIFYFEGDLSLSGYPNINADNSASNTFTNSFLAEGDIEAILYSPKVYSPYNVLRETNTSIICNRKLKTIKGADLTTTTPASDSNSYLTPINLCKNSTEFKYDMNLDASAQKTTVSIDNQAIEKLDLGYVALMSNKMIRYGTCAKIYGDVLARSTIEGSNACINDSATITGNISSQGIPPYLQNIKQDNIFGADSKTILPKQEFTNTKNNTGTETQTGLVVNTGTLKWAKYL